MTSKRTYCKALVLLIVFSTSSVVSFACSLGGFFHSLHHRSSTEAPSPQNHHGEHHKQDKGHHHEHGETKHHDHTDDNVPVKDECCSETVAETEKLDKSVSRTIEAPKAIFLTSFLFAYSPIYYTLTVNTTDFNPQFVRWRTPTTIPDLRIAIQSFQI